MKVPFTNRKAHPVPVGNVRVYPGETRMVEERDHPDFGRAEADRQAQRPRKERSDPVLALLDNSVDDIIPKLPELSDEDFDRLVQGEKDGKTRKSLQKAFDAEHFRRAELRVDGEGAGSGE